LLKDVSDINKEYRKMMVLSRFVWMKYFCSTPPTKFYAIWFQLLLVLILRVMLITTVH